MTSSGDCDGDRATAVRLGQDLVSHRLLTPVCAGYDRPKDSPGGGATGDESEPADLFGSFDDAAGWLFAFEGDALRNPFAPPPPIQVAVMTSTGVEVGVTGWTEVRTFVALFCGAFRFETAVFSGWCWDFRRGGWARGARVCVCASANQESGGCPLKGARISLSVSWLFCGAADAEARARSFCAFLKRF